MARTNGAPWARPPILIAGATASGKSALAMRLAVDLDGVVINADSMQVYRELRLITNRPTPEDEAAVPHALYGFRAAAEPYSAALWLKDVEQALAEAAASGKAPIIVGGTGLYFTALTQGLSAIPHIDPAIRAHYRRAAQEGGASALHAELARKDPVMARRLAPSDTQRISRALEVLASTGRSLASWQEAREPPLVPLTNTTIERRAELKSAPAALALVLTVEREELYARSDARFDRLVTAGAIEEARAFRALGLSPTLPATRAVGLRELIAYAEGRASLNEAVFAAKVATRRYVKRQLTWIESNFKTWMRVYENEEERIKREYCNFFMDLDGCSSRAYGRTTVET